MFLSRESIRLVCLRESVGSLEERQQLVNISWLPAILILFASTVILWYTPRKSLPPSLADVNPIGTPIIIGPLYYCTVLVHLLSHWVSHGTIVTWLT